MGFHENVSSELIMTLLCKIGFKKSQLSINPKFSFFDGIKQQKHLKVLKHTPYTTHKPRRNTLNLIEYTEIFPAFTFG